ncbi:MAG: GbsR/MarR family transcriptional regulator, partial [bacterium]
MSVEVSDRAEQFILHWGEMGTRWGINRTVAQVHALLYVWPEPLDTQTIADTLSVSRSNVSNSLKELESWGIVDVVQKMGDRKDYYETMEDVWEMFRIITAERKKREIDPTLSVLRECTQGDNEAEGRDQYALERLTELRDFMEQGAGVCEDIQNMDAEK